LEAINDAVTIANTGMQFIRSGTNVSSVDFPNGNVGIGTTSPGAKLVTYDGSNMRVHIGANLPGYANDNPAVALSRWTGSGDNYNSYILTSLYDAGTGGYGLAFRSTIGNHPIADFDSGGTPTTKVFFGYTGNVGIGTTSPNSSKGTGGYLDVNDVYMRDVSRWASESTLKTYVGATASTYTGLGVGGYSGGDSKCASAYGTGARMCIAADFVNGRPSTIGWYNTFTWSMFVNGAVVGYPSDCLGWLSNSPAYYGNIWGTSGGYPWGNSCDVSYKILCCK
jgi:hypothetical protein